MARPWFTFNVSVDDAGKGVLSASSANGAEAPACAASRVSSILFASVSEVVVATHIHSGFIIRSKIDSGRKSCRHGDVLTLLQSDKNSVANLVPKITRVPTGFWEWVFGPIIWRSLCHCR